jgi:hypothetical protein
MALLHLNLFEPSVFGKAWTMDMKFGKKKLARYEEVLVSVD